MTSPKDLFFEDLLFEESQDSHQQLKPTRRRSSNSKYKKQNHTENDKRKNSNKINYIPNQIEKSSSYSSSFTQKHSKFSKSFSPKFGSIPLESPKIELEDGIIIEIENFNEDKLKNQKEIFDKITTFSTIVSVDKLKQSNLDAFLLTFNENLDEVLEKIQNLQFDENNFKIIARKSKESKMIVLKNIPFKLKSEDLTDLIVSQSKSHSFFQRKRNVEGLKNIKYQYKDNAFIGFAFASFGTEKEAFDSIEKINGLTVMNRTITAEIKKNPRKESFSYNNQNSLPSSLPNQGGVGSIPNSPIPEKSIKDLKKTLEKNKKKVHHIDSPSKIEVHSTEEKKKKILLIEGDEILLKIYESIDKYIKEPNQTYMSFPSDLNSFYRKKIHSLSEQLELNSYSQGKGEDRFISLKKIDSVDYSSFEISIVKTKAIPSPMPSKDINVEPIIFSKINPLYSRKEQVKEAKTPDGTIGFQGIGRGKPIKNEK